MEQGGTYNGQTVAPITYGKFGPQVYETPMHQYGSRSSMSYVTGAHNFKVGMDLQQGFRNRISANFADDIAFRTQGFVLNQVTIYAPSRAYRSNLDYNLGLYVQDRWRIGRVAVSPGVRFEFQKESNDAFWAKTYKIPAEPQFGVPAADVTHWKEVNPRIGVSYNLFGNGRTAVKAS